jgi:hypothetical protein
MHFIGEQNPARAHDTLCSGCSIVGDHRCWKVVGRITSHANTATAVSEQASRAFTMRSPGRSSL